MTRSRTILCKLPLLLLFPLLASPAGAQYIYGVTALQLDPDVGFAYGYSATELDYYACYYYDAVVMGTLYEDGMSIDSDSYYGGCAARAYTGGFLRDDRYYTQHTDHYVVAYYQDYYYGYYDPYGYGYAGPNDYGGGFNYYGYYGPYYFEQSTYYIGWTRVTLFNPGPCSKAPTFSGPTKATRGGPAVTFKLEGVCSTATVNWSFSDGINPPVTRSGGTSWPGTMVTSGTVSVTVRQGGKTYNFSKAVTVAARTNFAFPAAAPSQRNNNFSCQENGTIGVPVVPFAGGRLGQTCLIQRASSTPKTLGDNGPNHGYTYVLSASPTDSSQPLAATAVYYVIHPDLENPSSEFFRAQCGNFNASTSTGFISGSELLNNTRNHEIGSVKGHYQQYVAAQSKAENNIGVGIESIVGAPSMPITDFRSAVNAEVNRRRNIIEAAFAAEACNHNVNLDEQCNDHGPINFFPYQPCPPGRPLSFSGSAISNTQVDLSWSDDSGDEQGFKIERSDNWGAFVEIASLGANVTTYSDTSAVPNMTYAYQVRAWNSVGSSAPSDQVTVMTFTPAPPAAPCCLHGEESIHGGGAVTFFWTDMSDNEDGFTLERSDTWEGEFVAIGSTLSNQTSFTDYGLKTGQLYRYRVVAVNAYGQSYSEELYFSSAEW